MRPAGGGGSRKQLWASCLLRELLLQQGSCAGSARLTVLSHQAFRGQTGRGQETRLDSDLAGRKGAVGETPTGVSKAKLDSMSFKKESCREPVRDKAASNGEIRVPKRDQRKRTTSYSLAKQVKLRDNPFSPIP